MKQLLLILIVVFLYSCDDPMSTETPREIDVIETPDEVVEIKSLKLEIGGELLNTNDDNKIIQNDHIIIENFYAENNNQSQILKSIVIQKLEFDLENRIIVSNTGYFSGELLRRDYISPIAIDGSNKIELKLKNNSAGKIEFDINLEIQFPRLYTDTGKLTIEY